MLLVLLPLVLELARHLLPEHCHMLLNTLLNLLLNKERNSLAHVHRNLLQLRIILPIENICLESLTRFCIHHLRSL